jgi:alpha-amylase/alpha-mannosidase (GH57 family)
MHELSLAFVWHQHQPYYPDDVTGFNPMPWVRLHGSKDYWGMAMHLDEVPEVHATINLVPSLLAQILAYTEHGRQDDHLRVSRLPADSLGEADRLYLLDNFFMAHPQHMIRPYARYWELYEQRAMGREDAARAARRFSSQDVLDLQCWSNLIWFHPIALERDKSLAEFRRKGRHWTEDEKQWMLDKQMKLLAEVIPLHRKLAKRGQVELTTTPFYHPILPLLIDKRLARVAMPHVDLPRHLDGYADDADEQLRRAVEYHTRLFGSPPVGLWPSEGSVSQEVIGPIARAGISWFASDEEILMRSAEGRVFRDGQGMVQHPELLYRPWQVEDGGHALSMIFRDHALSDLIGFQYQRYEAQQAADDMIGKLEAIHRATTARDAKLAPLASIILDGENCWEYYPNGGVDFLRSLYQRIARHPQIKAVRVRDYLERHPATEKLGHLFAGSWISHNFAIWIGHPACNRAWDLVSETRAMLIEQSSESELPPEKLERAWEELYIAEGSDWFWWFDDHHSSQQDSLFDQLFRKHLANVYALVGVEPPSTLLEPIGQVSREPPFTQPTGLLTVRIDGRETYFEWINAGKYSATAARGTMTMADGGRLERVLYGFDAERLLLRFDAPGAMTTRLANVEVLRVGFVEPRGFELLVLDPGSKRPRAQLFHNDVPVSAAGTEAACGAILEIALPWRRLGVDVDAPLKFYAELVAHERPLERIPSEGTIETRIPSPDFELMMWQA